MSRKQQRSLALTAAGALVVGGAFSAVAPTQAAPSAPSAAENVATVQILGVNDFHGRILPSTSSGEAGAAVLAGAVDDLEADYPNTVFSAAGDLIGASTFESFISQDKPTIDALNEAGLDVSAVGNHEFDQGFDDLKNRVMAPYDATMNPFGGAEWTYLGANVKMKASGSPALEPSYVQTFNDGLPNEVEVGFVGAVTEHLGELVAPDGIAEITVTDIPAAVNAEADTLKAAGADLIVLLVHEGAAKTDLASATDPASDFGKIVNGVDADVDAIISGHTHLAYNHTIAGRPVVSAGQYGLKLNQLVFDVDGATGESTVVAQNVVELTRNEPIAGPNGPVANWIANYPADPAVQAIIDEAKAEADVLGAAKIGELASPLNRARLADTTTENRGGESALSNLVAEVQRAQTPADLGGSQIAFMNPGGLRADLKPAPDGSITYRQAATVQPFANTLVRMKLTGAQIKAVLEEQWQPDGAQRPFLRLGTSKGFAYTYDPTNPRGQRISSVTLNGTALGATTSYAVTVNSFLASGGDNFTTLAAGTEKRETGVTDLQAMVDYLKPLGDTPLEPDFAQHSVGVTADRASYLPGAKATLTLSSLISASPDAVKDATISVKAGTGPAVEVPVDGTVSTDPDDENGTATVALTVPANAPRGGTVPVTITGATTGTSISFTLPVAPKTSASIRATVTPKKIRAKRTTVKLKIEVRGASKATGTVVVKVAGKTRRATLRNGKAVVKLGKFKRPGKVKATITYSGNAALTKATKKITFRVRR